MTPSPRDPITRRRLLGTVALGAAGTLAPRWVGPASTQDVAPGAGAAGIRWVVTTQKERWQERGGATRTAPSLESLWNVEALVDKPLQRIDGFGACFNELGWLALGALTEADRGAVLGELFAPEGGARFNMCRMPVAANDFARDWYSYDETAGDFALRDFSIAHDLETLVPFIKAAQARQPALRLWASPWSPPTWMKYNGHYATRAASPGQPPNGLRADQAGTEGKDMFIQEERYFRAYARYFAHFVEEYRKQGIAVAMVMPQNEFNSNQPFPSCCWSAQGLARFVPFLGAEMEKLGVDVFLGTMERPDHGLLAPTLDDPRARRFVKGIGVQWAGKHALAGLHQDHPELALYQSEQECGDGRNDWRYCRYAWTLMKKFFESGTNAYFYWNIALTQGGVSRWGWAQNSLLTVDAAARTYTWNAEYFLLKHVSHFVRPGAHRLEMQGWSGYENLLAFANPDGSVAVVAQNDLAEEMPLRVKVGSAVIGATLPADSFNTFLVPPA